MAGNDVKAMCDLFSLVGMPKMEISLLRFSVCRANLTVDILNRVGFGNSQRFGLLP